MIESRLNTHYNHLSDRPKNDFLTYAQRDGLRHTLENDLVIKEWPIEFEPLVMTTHRDGEGTRTALLEYPNLGFVFTSHRGSYLSFEMAAGNQADLEELRHKFEQPLEITEVDEDSTDVEVKFWMMGHHGPTNISRNIEIPTWEQVKGNYNGDTSDMLGPLMAMKTWDPTRGKLILWRGSPGLGKTYALRALLREWRTWAEFSYISDPEVFFGASADYLLQVLLSTTPEWEEDDAGNMKRKDSGKWRLIILEDAGELLGQEARTQTGQALSRLLNTVDGMLGQGLKCLLLVTTNEDISKLHPAVSRPGRCAINSEFQKFSKSEAEAWLENSGHQDKLDQVGNSMTLAELYALSMGIDVKVGSAIGFQ